jgi:PIN domain nuclease of toxin-antitoxin system
VRALLDTHAVLWAAEDDGRLGAGARRFLSETPVGEAAVADISLLEIAMLAAKGRIRLAVPCATYLEGLIRNFPIVPIDAGIAAEAMDLKLAQADPFDRVIVATARRHGVPLLTRDAAIRESGLVETFW